MLMKILAIQSSVLVLLVWTASQHFASRQRIELMASQEILSAELKGIEQRLARLEQSASRASTTTPFAGGASPARNDAGGKEILAQLSHRLEVLEARGEKMLATADDLRADQALLAQAQKQAQPESVRVRNWMSALDEEKKAQVQAAYREQLDRMQTIISASPDAPPPDPEEMRNLLLESRESLKLKLKDVLDESEYQAFLDSLDEEGELSSAPPPLLQ